MDQEQQQELTKARTIHDELKKTDDYDKATQHMEEQHMTEDERQIAQAKRMEIERQKREQNLILDKLNIQLVLFQRLKRKELKNVKNKRDVANLVRFQTVELNISQIPEILNSIKAQNAGKSVNSDDIVENFDLGKYDVAGLNNNQIRKTDNVERLRYFILFLIKYNLKLKINRDYRVLANMQEQLQIDHIDKNDVFLVFSQYIMSNMRQNLRSYGVQNSSTIRVILKQNIANLNNIQIVDIHNMDSFFKNVSGQFFFFFAIYFIFIFLFLSILFVFGDLFVCDSRSLVLLCFCCVVVLLFVRACLLLFCGEWFFCFFVLYIFLVFHLFLPFSILFCLLFLLIV